MIRVSPVSLFVIVLCRNGNLPLSASPEDLADGQLDFLPPVLRLWWCAGIWRLTQKCQNLAFFFLE
jgi:hypothetical protein